MFDLMLTRIRELRFRYTGYHIEVLIPEDKYESLFEHISTSELYDMLCEHRLHYLYQIFAKKRNLFKLKLEMLTWLKGHSPYRFQSFELPGIHDGIPLIILISRRVTVQFCHPESAALFKLTWL